MRAAGLRSTSKSRENVGCAQPESWRGRFPPLMALSNTSSLTSARRSVWRFRVKPFTIWDCASTNASRPVRIGIFCFRRQRCAAWPIRPKSRVFIAGGHIMKAQDRSILNRNGQETTNRFEASLRTHRSSCRKGRVRGLSNLSKQATGWGRSRPSVTPPPTGCGHCRVNVTTSRIGYGRRIVSATRR